MRDLLTKLFCFPSEVTKIRLKIRGSKRNETSGLIEHVTPPPFLNSHDVSKIVSDF